ALRQMLQATVAEQIGALEGRLLERIAEVDGRMKNIEEDLRGVASRVDAIAREAAPVEERSNGHFSAVRESLRRMAEDARATAGDLRADIATLAAEIRKSRKRSWL